MIDRRVLAELRRALAQDRVRTDPDWIERCSRDETEDLRYPPEAVVLPVSTAEVAVVMRIATRERIPVTTRGAGTGLSGGALPVAGGLVLATERMDRILEIDERNMMAVVEPGVITGELQRQVEELGLFYPPDPASLDSCTIGGNVAENAGGPRAVKYGVTGHWVTGLTAVLADGSVVRAGGKLRKNVTGLDLVGLLVGSEGTLAIVTRVVLRLIPLPRHHCSLLASFDSLDDAAEAVERVHGTGVIPAACEFLEREALRVAEEHLGVRVAPEGVEALLLLDFDGRDPDAVQAEALLAGEALQAREVLVADDARRREELWRVRRACGEAVKRISAYRELDTVVPRSAIPDLVRAVREEVAALGVRAVIYGHAGDGNLHVNILKQGVADERWDALADEASRRVLASAHRLGGMPTGEHGCGLTVRPHLAACLDPPTLEAMRSIKRALDPLGLLNPSKML